MADDFPFQADTNTLFQAPQAPLLPAAPKKPPTQPSNFVPTTPTSFSTPEVEQQYIERIAPEAEQLWQADERMAGAIGGAQAQMTKQFTEMRAAQGAELGKLQPFKEEYQPASIWEQFGSPAFIMSMLASSFSAQPLNAALTSGGAAMQALNQGKMDEYQRHFDLWKQNADIAAKRFELEGKMWTEATEKAHLDIESATAIARANAARFQDVKAAAMIEAGMLPEVLEYKTKEQALQKQYAEATAEITKANGALQFAHSWAKDTGMVDAQGNPTLQGIAEGQRRFEAMDKPQEAAFLAMLDEHRVAGTPVTSDTITDWQRKWSEAARPKIGTPEQQLLERAIQDSDATAVSGESPEARENRRLKVMEKFSAAKKGIPLGRLSAEELEGLGWSQRAIDMAAITYNLTGQVPKTASSRQFGGQVMGAIYDRADQIWEASGRTPEQRTKEWQKYSAEKINIQRWDTGKQGDIVRALNVSVQHLHTLQRLADAVHAGKNQLANKIKQEIAILTGQAAPTNLATAAQILGGEITKSLTNSGAGALADRIEQASHFNRIQSPEQMTGAVNTAEELLSGQLRGLRTQFLASTRLPAEDFNVLLDSQTRIDLERFERPAETQELKPGDERKGYRFKGGNWRDKNNWEKL